MYSTWTVLVKIKYTLSEYNGMQVMSRIRVTIRFMSLSFYAIVALCVLYTERLTDGEG